MIPLIATAAVLSCHDAQAIINRIDSTDFSRREYSELVNSIAQSAPARCYLSANPGLFRRQARNLERHQPHYQPHIIVRPVIRWHF